MQGIHQKSLVYGKVLHNSQADDHDKMQVYHDIKRTGVWDGRRKAPYWRCSRNKSDGEACR